jgi:hypothetical protein
MPQWMQDLTAGWPMIRANVPTFVVLAALMFGAIWWLMDWRYGGIITGRDGIIANKDSEIILLRGQRDDYKDKLSGATPDQAKARIDALEASLEARLAAVEPRRLTAAQRAAMIARLSPPAGTTPAIIIVGEASGDGPQYAADFASVFQSVGGWKVGEGSAMGIGNRPATGIALNATNVNSPEASSVANALHAANIDFDVRQGPMQEGIAVQLVVCTKIVR